MTAALQHALTISTRLSSLYRYQSPKIFNVFIVTGVEVTPQHGPTCGMSCLSTALHWSLHQHVSIDSIVDTARRLGISKKGELFDARACLELARESGLAASLRSWLSTQDVFQWWRENPNCVIMVPYDKDANNEPCHRNGVKAHWCMIVGVSLVADDVPSLNERVARSEGEVDDFLLYRDHLISMYEMQKRAPLMLSESTRPASHTALICVHGLSKYPGVWPLLDLFSSCNQLNQVDDALSATEFHLPPSGNIAHTLKGQVILIGREGDGQDSDAEL